MKFHHSWPPLENTILTPMSAAQYKLSDLFDAASAEHRLIDLTSRLFVLAACMISQEKNFRLHVTVVRSRNMNTLILLWGRWTINPKKLDKVSLLCRKAGSSLCIQGVSNW